MKVLLVDDNQQVMETLTDYLELSGVQVDCAYNGVSALALLKQQSFDVIVMDIMMPKLDGISTVQQIRQELLCQTPVLFLTAKDALVDKEAAFEAGGDDYLVKPFALKELQLRLEALSKRGVRQDLSTLVLGDVKLDLNSLSATKGDRPLKLSRIQLQILKLLLQKSPAVVSRQYLTEQIWGDEEPASDVLRSHVYAIRNQLSPQQERPVLETLHGQGISLFYKGNSSFFRRVTLITSVLSLVFISLFWIVILVAEDQMEVISLDHWLDAEARMYERDYQLSGAAADLPNHYEFDSYWSEESMPLWLKEYTTPGYYEHHLGPEDKHFLVRPHPSGKGLFYVVFKDNADDYLDEYESKLHLFTLLFGFAIVLLTFCYGVYMVRQMAVPLRNLVSKIKQMSPEQPSFVVEAAVEELRTIEQALFDSKKHIAAFFQREQEFSRFAAHEIRTPLMVLQGSAELLQTMLAEEPRSHKALLRIERACRDIALLTDTFLLLGKERIDAHHYQQLDLETLLREQLPLAQSAATSDSARWTMQVHHQVQLWAPQSFVRVVLINLLKNAFIHGEGELLIELSERQLRVSNSSSKEQDSQGYGYGLVIVERICSRMGWQLEVLHQSSDFCVYISFPPVPLNTV